MNKSLYLVTHSTPLGEMCIIHDGSHITRANWLDIWSPGDRSIYHTDLSHPLSVEIVMWLDRYFAWDFAHLPRLSYRLEGTPLMQKVLSTLSETHPGEVISYRSLAERSGHLLAIRRVASVMADNLIPLLIPCHRVVRSDGSIGEYSAGGPDRKRWLLEHEKRYRV